MEVALRGGTVAEKDYCNVLVAPCWVAFECVAYTGSLRDLGGEWGGDRVEVVLF